MASQYDVIVLGLGGMGSAALYHLARRGARVVGIEQFAVGNDRGSSHGQTRLIRQAYFEHPDYVPLLRRAYELWSELGQHSGQLLLDPTGLVIWGPPVGGKVLPNLVASAQVHNVPIEIFDDDAARRRFPLHQPPEGYRAVWEPNAGFLHVEACVLAHVHAAVSAGALVKAGTKAISWRPDGAGVAVELAAETVRAKTLVLTQGAWSGAVLHELGVELKVHRNSLVWLQASENHSRVSGAPCFAFDLPTGFFYGFPSLDERGVKVALHLPGDPVTDLDARDAPPTAQDAAPVVEFAQNCLKGVGPQVTQIRTCRYEMSPDDHFVVDTHPNWPQVVVAGGFSGHGFKFASVMGEVLADLALSGRTAMPVEFLSARRFSRPTSASSLV